MLGEVDHEIFPTQEEPKVVVNVVIRLLQTLVVPIILIFEGKYNDGV
jgi:capsular polysaccharide biosynthesis protein